MCRAYMGVRADPARGGGVILWLMGHDPFPAFHTANTKSHEGTGAASQSPSLPAALPCGDPISKCVPPPEGSPVPVPSSSSNHVKLFPFCCSREEGLGGCPAAPQSCSIAGSLPAWAGGREEGENGNLTPAPTNPRGHCASAWESAVGQRATAAHVPVSHRMAAPRSKADKGRLGKAQRWLGSV